MPRSSRSLLPEVRIDREALTTIIAHARRDAPNECCGLLVGRPGEILEAVPARNEAAEPARSYQISPADYFAQIRRCRKINQAQSGNFAVVGAYHSHPHSAPEPSETDNVQAFRDFVFVIAGPAAAGQGMEVRAYALGGETLTPLEMILT